MQTIACSKCAKPLVVPLAGVKFPVARTVECEHCGAVWFVTVPPRGTDRRCGGTFMNGPQKAYARCGRCRALDCEANEGDRCNRTICEVRGYEIALSERRPKA